MSETSNCVRLAEPKGEWISWCWKAVWEFCLYLAGSAVIENTEIIIPPKKTRAICQIWTAKFWGSLGSM